MKTYKLMVLLLAFFISGSLSGAAEESQLILSVQNETKLARTIDAFISCRKSTREAELPYFVPTPFARSSRIQRLVQKALDMGGATSNSRHDIGWCVCEKASFGRRIVLLNKIITDMLQSRPERHERLVIATIGGGQLLFEYLLIDELLLAGYQDIHVINIDPLDQYFYSDGDHLSSDEVSMRLVEAFKFALKDRATVQAYIDGLGFCEAQGAAEPSVVYYGIPNVESWNTDFIPLADYVLTIDLFAKSLVVDTHAKEINPCSRCNMLELHGAEGGSDIICIVFDITPGPITKATPPPIAWKRDGCVSERGVVALIEAALKEEPDRSDLAGVILSNLRKVRWGQFFTITMRNVGHVELYYNFEKVCNPGARIYHLDGQRAQDVTSIFLENSMDPIRFMAQLFASNQ